MRELRVSLVAAIALTGCGDAVDGPLGVGLEAQGAPSCDVAIVGGGPGGVHTAYKLTTLGLTQGPVCLFEKTDHLGGRVGDNFAVGLDAQPYVNGGVPVVGSGQTGTGGYRMYRNQYTYQLGQELAALGSPGQLTFLPQISFSRLAAVKNRGYSAKLAAPTYFTYNNSGVAKAFAPLYGSPINDNDMWKVLLCGPQVPVDGHGAPQYAQMAIPGLGSMSTADYLEWVAAHVIAPANGPEVAQYMLDVWRFRSDFAEPNDAVSYLAFSAKDYTGGTVIYPIPSFQPYFDIMQAQIEKYGGQIYLNEKVLSVSSQGAGAGYVLTTSKQTVTAHTVILAIPHAALASSDPSNVSGDVISRIIAQPQFQYAHAGAAITVTHQFGDGKKGGTGFWHGDITYPSAPNLLGPQLSASSSPLRRSTNDVKLYGDKLPGCQSPSCDFSHTLFYNNTNELPLTDYHDFINVSRSVYNDDHEAVDNWLALYAAGGDDAVNAQILKSLRLMYPKVFTGDPAVEPPILATRLTVHNPAWYNLKQGALAGGVDNDSMFAWSLSPLPGERVYLVGDSWRNDVSGWSDGAYKGSIYVLNRYFQANIDPKEPATIHCVGGDIVDPN